MRFSKQLEYIATFAVAALVVYLIGGALNAVWPMWGMMWGMGDSASAGCWPWSRC